MKKLELDILTRKRYKTNESYYIKIIDYINKDNVLIQFVDFPDLQRWTTMQNIRNGELKNPLHRSVYNIGYFGIGNYKSRINGIKTNQYVKWISMFVRCYDINYLNSEPSYNECDVDESFHNFQNFAKWYDVKFYECPFPLELDKDLLVPNNKTYKPSNCCFIPEEINTNLNYTRNNNTIMKYYYNKYKDFIPYYIKNKLYKLSLGEE